MNISEINKMALEEKKLPPAVATEGFIATEIRRDKQMVKYLLYKEYSSSSSTRKGPAVLLSFYRDDWDIDVRGGWVGLRVGRRCGWVRVQDLRVD